MALGDLWLLPATGGKPQNLTNDAAYDVDPTWSPDGRYLAWSTDRAGGLLQIWIRDMQTGQMRQLTHISTQPTSLQFSPDGKRIAFVNVDTMWRGASVAVADVATGDVKIIHKSIFAPGTPTWSPDGKRIALAMVAPYNRKYREGTNQVLTMSSTGTEADDATTISGSRRSPTCRSTAAAGTARSGRPTAPRCWRSMKASWRSGRSRPLPASRRDRCAI